MSDDARRLVRECEDSFGGLRCMRLQSLRRTHRASAVPQLAARALPTPSKTCHGQAHIHIDMRMDTQAHAQTRWQQDIMCRANWVSDGKRWADYQSVLFKVVLICMIGLVLTTCPQRYTTFHIGKRIHHMRVIRLRTKRARNLYRSRLSFLTACPRPRVRVHGG